MDLQPGKLVSVQIKSAPRSEAARKTLARLLRKDADVARRERARARKRPSWQTKRRGGRLWHHQMRSQPLATVSVGATYRLFASVDVIRDLQSVSRFVEVKPA